MCRTFWLGILAGVYLSFGVCKCEQAACLLLHLLAIS